MNNYYAIYPLLEQLVNNYQRTAYNKIKPLLKSYMIYKLLL